jgi:hypothetical protein
VACGEGLVVADTAAVFADPGQCPLGDPSSEQYHESWIGAFDDRDRHSQYLARSDGQSTSIAGVGPDQSGGGGFAVFAGPHLVAQRVVDAMPRTEFRPSTEKSGLDWRESGLDNLDLPGVLHIWRKPRRLTRVLRRSLRVMVPAAGYQCFPKHTVGESITLIHRIALRGKQFVTGKGR